jgi:hypothetical protein
MKSGGVAASPASTNAFPGSDRLVPNTTIPENRDCAAPAAGWASIETVIMTGIHRPITVDVDAIPLMARPSQSCAVVDPAGVFRRTTSFGDHAWSPVR